MVDTDLAHFTAAADAREIAADLERVALILQAMTHESTVHDNNNSCGPPLGPDGVATWSVAG